MVKEPNADGDDEFEKKSLSFNSEVGCAEEGSFQSTIPPRTTRAVQAINESYRPELNSQAARVKTVMQLE